MIHYRVLLLFCGRSSSDHWGPSGIDWDPGRPRRGGLGAQGSGSCARVPAGVLAGPQAPLYGPCGWLWLCVGTCGRVVSSPFFYCSFHSCTFLSSISDVKGATTHHTDIYLYHYLFYSQFILFCSLTVHRSPIQFLKIVFILFYI